MREMQKELMDEYLQDIHEMDTHEAKRDQLFRIIKTEQNTPANTLNWILTLLLLGLVVVAQIQGKYLSNEINIVEVCEGKPVNENLTIILNDGQPIDVYNHNTSLSTGKEDAPWLNN